MRMMTSYIFLRDVRFHAFHGVLPQETAVGADFVLSLRLGYDVSAAMTSDDVSDTLNYAEAYQLVKREMDIPSRLLEHVAGRIVNAIVENFPAVTSIDMELTKVNPPMGADCGGAGVEIHINK
ncbi:MAG: dihydroneopterin aldolase [Prevotella sp.]|nr:dihydroneopterin aldolase [Prevotella sp.]